MPTLTCLGAARTVTGSKHLLRTDAGHRVLVDCGMFQGLKALRERNWQALPVDAREIETVVLTHAHLDHCGYLPRLVAHGFRGRIFCTEATAELARIVLADAAKLQEEDAERANRRHYTKHHPALPLFTSADAARAMTLLQPAGYDRPLPVAPGVEVQFLDAGHLLGSAFVRATLAGTGQTVLFGGDLGRYGRPVLPDPTTVESADVLLCESTYGDRLHEPDDDGKRLAAIVNDTFDRGGKLVIPSFALGRVEELLYWFHTLEARGAIPTRPVYVDSPMAALALAAYRSHADQLEWPHPGSVAHPGADAALGSPTDRAVRGPGADERAAPPASIGDRAAAYGRVCAFCTARLTVVESIQQSRDIQESSAPAVVISSSGMATGGRVLHHLERVLPDARNTVLFVGYQAAGTRGRTLRDGAHVVKLHGREIPVRARIEAIDSMSAHADANEIMRWLGGFTKPPTLTCLVHGEPGPMDALKARIERELRWTVKTPEPLERMEI